MVGPEDTLFSRGQKSTMKRANVPELSTRWVTSPLQRFYPEEVTDPWVAGWGGGCLCWADLKQGGHPSPDVLVLGSEPGCFSHGHVAWWAKEGTWPLCPFPAARLTLTHHHFIS